MSPLEARLRRLEALTGWHGDDGDDGTVFTVDICADPTRYWIDDVEVSEDEYRRRVPPDSAFTSFVIDIGDAHLPRGL